MFFYATARERREAACKAALEIPAQRVLPLAPTWPVLYPTRARGFEGGVYSVTIGGKPQDFGFESLFQAVEQLALLASRHPEYRDWIVYDRQTGQALAIPERSRK